VRFLFPFSPDKAYYPYKLSFMLEIQFVSSILQLQGLSPSNLTDKLNAIEVGRLLHADYIMTGTVIETENTFIIFSRLLNVKNGEVAPSAQVIVSKA
jgi:TolB-like protein